MSQEQTSNQRQCHPSDAAMASQRSAFVGPAPNMLPMTSADVFRASAIGSPMLAPGSYASLPGGSFTAAYPHYPPFPDLAYPFPKQYPVMPRQRKQTNDPINGGVDFNDLIQKARSEEKATTPVLPSLKRSRLPTNNAPRKMPRKAYGADTPFHERSTATPSASRNRRIVLDEDDDADLPLASIEAGAATDSPSPSAQTESPPPQIHDSPRADAQIRGPRPRHNYIVPKQLEGVQIALGADNWNEYLALAENLCMGEITRDKFAARTRRIFLTFNDTIRKKIDNLMVTKVVAPVLEKKEEEVRKGKARPYVASYAIA